jgi:alpha-N-acetylglucosamine transferase
MVIFHSYVTNYQRVIFLEKNAVLSSSSKLSKLIFSSPFSQQSSSGPALTSSDFLRNTLPRTKKDFKQQQDGYVSQTGKHQTIQTVTTVGI